MATMRVQANGKVFVEIRRVGTPTIRKTLPTKTHAIRFARRVESQIDEGTYNDPNSFDQTVTLPEVLDFYLDELLDGTKPPGKSKISCINRMKREPLFQGLSVVELSPKILHTYVKKRRRKVGPKTMGDDLTYIKQAINMAKTVKSLDLGPNVVEQMLVYFSSKGLVGKSKRRVRRLKEGEEQALYMATAGDWLNSIIRIALATGMRQEEIHKLEWEDIDWDEGLMTVRDRKDPHNKDGNDSIIPLLDPVRAVLEREFYRASGRKVFTRPIRSASVSDKFAKKAEQIGSPDLTFHDIRHEALSRLFEMGLTIPEVSLLSGHKNWESLKRYVHLNPKSLASKLGK